MLHIRRPANQLVAVGGGSSSNDIEIISAPLCYILREIVFCILLCFRILTVVRNFINPEKSS